MGGQNKQEGLENSLKIDRDGQEENCVSLCSLKQILHSFNTVKLTSTY